MTKRQRLEQVLAEQDQLAARLRRRPPEEERRMLQDRRSLLAHERWWLEAQLAAADGLMRSREELRPGHRR